MKRLAFFPAIYLIICSFACERTNNVSTEIQAAQDLVKGEWVISDASEGFVGTIPKEKVKGGRFIFAPCNAKDIDGQNRLCMGDAIIDGTTYQLFYYNNSQKSEFQITILLEPPYGASELLTIKTFSGIYELVKNDSEIKFVLKRKGDTINNDTDINFELTRK